MRLTKSRNAFLFDNFFIYLAYKYISDILKNALAAHSSISYRLGTICMNILTSWLANDCHKGD